MLSVNDQNIRQDQTPPETGPLGPVTPDMPPPCADHLVNTLQMLLRADDYAWVASQSAGREAWNWRRERRRNVRLCCTEIWARSRVLLTEWSAVSAERQDFAGVDPHLERLKIGLALVAISMAATWRITFGLPMPAAIMDRMLAGLRHAAAPFPQTNTAGA